MSDDHGLLLIELSLLHSHHREKRWVSLSHREGYYETFVHGQILPAWGGMFPLNTQCLGFFLSWNRTFRCLRIRSEHASGKNSHWKTLYLTCVSGEYKHRALQKTCSISKGLVFWNIWEYSKVPVSVKMNKLDYFFISLRCDLSTSACWFCPTALLRHSLHCSGSLIGKRVLSWNKYWALAGVTDVTPVNNFIIHLLCWRLPVSRWNCHRYLSASAPIHSDTIIPSQLSC